LTARSNFPPTALQTPEFQCREWRRGGRLWGRTISFSFFNWSTSCFNLAEVSVNSNNLSSAFNCCGLSLIIWAINTIQP